MTSLSLIRLRLTSHQKVISCLLSFLIVGDAALLRADELRSSGWQPLADGSKLILAELKVKDQTGWFFIDTGSSNTILIPEFAARLPLGPKIGEGEISDGVNSKDKMPIYEALPVKFSNGYELQPEFLAVMSLSSVTQQSRNDVVGVIGLDAIQKSVLEMDPENGRYRICEEMSNEYAYGQNLFVRKRALGEFILDWEIEGVGMNLTIDTGNNGCLGFEPEDFAKFEEIGMLKNVYRGSTYSAMSSYTVKNGTFFKGRLMGRELRGVPLQTDKPYGYIGMSFMRCFRLALDVENSRLYYELRKDNYKGLLSTEFMAGAHFWHLAEGALINNLNYNGSPLKKLGVKKGDVIVRIGGYSHNQITAGAVYETCRKHAGEEVPIKVMRNGKLLYSGPLKLRKTIYEFDVE